MLSNLMGQQQVENKWQHMVAVICLTLTTRQQVKKVLPKFFELWPTPEAFLAGDHEVARKLITSLGMSNIRIVRLLKMSEDFLTWDGEDATKLYGIGKYGSDSYRLFYKNEIPDNIQDHELKRYVKEELLYENNHM